MTTQSLVQMPQWLSRINAMRDNANKDPMFGQYEYERACFWHMASIRVSTVRKVAEGSFQPCH